MYLDELDRCIGAYARAVSALRADEYVDPEALAEILLTYANAVHARHSVTGSADDLDRSIDLTLEAVRLAGAGLAGRASVWLRLGHLYDARFTTTTDPAD